MYAVVPSSLLSFTCNASIYMLFLLRVGCAEISVSPPSEVIHSALALAFALVQYAPTYSFTLPHKSTTMQKMAAPPADSEQQLAVMIRHMLFPAEADLAPARQRRRIWDASKRRAQDRS